jgi:hypothetical protein
MIPMFGMMRFHRRKTSFVHRKTLRYHGRAARRPVNVNDGLAGNLSRRAEIGAPALRPRQTTEEK